MIGAIAGDIIGSRYEGRRSASRDFEFFHERSDFTDDTVCTLAVARALMRDCDFATELRSLCRNHPWRGYGGMFRKWIEQPDAPPYGSYGNGAVMRVSAVGWFSRSLQDVERLSRAQAEVSHNHPDAIAASCAIAHSIFLLARKQTAGDIRKMIEPTYGYDLSDEAISGRPSFDISAKGTAQTALTIALRSSSFEDAIRDAVVIGGDTDTLACVTGAIAEAIHGVPNHFFAQAMARLTPDLQEIVEKFEEVRAWRPRSVS
jgi:ADP-ribosylglycohydrolase